MSIEKCLDLTNGYNRKSDESTPTTRGDMYRFISNQNNVLMNLAKGLWQPATAYTVGAIIRSPSLPAGCVATCTTAGTSGTTEPKWTAYGTTVTDGACKWKVNTDSQDTMVSERNKAIDDLHAAITKETASAIKAAVDAAVAGVTKTLSDNMHAQYPVGCYLYSDKADNPATYLPYMSDTTWVQTAAGRVLIGAGTADSGTVYNAGDTGGEEKHQLTVDEMPTHGHMVRSWNAVNYSGRAKVFRASWIDSGLTNYFHPSGEWDSNNNNAPQNGTGDPSGTTDGTGNGHPHNNMEPFAVVYIFKRTA